MASDHEDAQDFYRKIHDAEKPEPDEEPKPEAEPDPEETVENAGALA